MFMGHENSPNTTQNEAHNIHLGEYEACKNGWPVHSGVVFILQFVKAVILTKTKTEL